MQHLETDTDTDPSSLYWGEKEQTASVLIPLMTRNVPSNNSGILASVDNPVSTQANGNDSMSFALSR